MFSDINKSTLYEPNTFFLPEFLERLKKSLPECSYKDYIKKNLLKFNIVYLNYYLVIIINIDKSIFSLKVYSFTKNLVASLTNITETELFDFINTYFYRSNLSYVTEIEYKVLGNKNGLTKRFSYDTFLSFKEVEEIVKIREGDNKIDLNSIKLRKYPKM
jgi:hypothetical protein